MLSLDILLNECEKNMTISDESEKIKQFQTFFESLESEMAQIQNREAVKIKIQKGNTTPGIVDSPYYDRETKTITLFITSGKTAINYLMSYIHESEHAKQHLSKDVSTSKSFMYKISDALYVDPPHEQNDNSLPVEYYYNYKEVEAKLAEINFLLDIYKKTKENNDILSLKDGKMFLHLFNDACNDMNLINHNSMREIIKSNNLRTTKFKELLTDNNLPHIKSKAFLTFVAPIMYLQLQGKANSIVNEVFKTQEELKHAYDHNITETIDLLNNKEKKNEENKQNIIQVLHSHEKMTDFIDAEVGIVEDIDGFKNYEKRLKELQNDSTIKAIFSMENIEGDYYRIVYSMYDSAANEVLNKSFVPAIATSFDEKDKEI